MGYHHYENSSDNLIIKGTIVPNKSTTNASDRDPMTYKREST